MKYLVSCLLIFLCVSCSSSDNDSNTTSPPNNTLATVSVVSVSNISENSATSGGDVTNDGGANVTSKGVCWSTTTNPTINDNKTSNGSGIGTYTSELTGLSSNTLYYVRAFATNSEGTAYSNVSSFTTEEEPIQCVNVLNTGIELKQQADVDELGAQGIIIINGFLDIKSNNSFDTDPITDLTPLSCLQEVNGYLKILQTPTIENLQGLENLKYTKGLVLSENENLVSIEALSNLETVDGNVNIFRNHKLTNLNGLNNITSVSGTMQIFSNDEIVSIEGLESIQSVGEELWIYDNPKLVDLTGLNNLTQIGKRLFISDNLQMTNINALSNLEITTAIKMENNPLITSISTFSNLTVSTLEWLSIKQNDALINLSGLENITTITDFLEVNYNDFLINIEGLNNLVSIGGYLKMTDNNVFSDLNGLSNLTSVGGDLIIFSGGALTDVCGLQPLFTANGLGGAYDVFIDNFDVTVQDIIDGDCSQ